jgi:hypothetical protein
VAGYLVRPVTLDMIRTGRSRAGRETSETVAGA